MDDSTDGTLGYFTPARPRRLRRLSFALGMACVLCAGAPLVGFMLGVRPVSRIAVAGAAFSLLGFAAGAAGIGREQDAMRVEGHHPVHHRSAAADVCGVGLLLNALAAVCSFWLLFG